MAQVASGYVGQLALTEALFGYPRRPSRWRGACPMDTTYEPQLRAATALALVGRGRRSRPLDRPAARPAPGRHAAARRLHAGRRRPRVLLARDRTDAALDALRPAAPFERGTVAALLPIYFRGEARRRAARLRRRGHATSASLIDSRGAEPFSSAIPMARLGLARALAASGDVAGSRRAYQDLLDDLEGRRSRSAGRCSRRGPKPPRLPQ